jgi:hypothetical protein
VPEPGSILLLGISGIGCGWIVRRRKQHAIAAK